MNFIHAFHAKNSFDKAVFRGMGQIVVTH